MAEWTKPPQPVTWTLDEPIELGPSVYTQVTLRAPKGADILKATAVYGEDGLTIAMRLISAISAEGVPFEAVTRIESWQIDQMSRYFDSFNGAPMPGPLAPPARAVADTAPRAA